MKILSVLFLLVTLLNAPTEKPLFSSEQLDSATATEFMKAPKHGVDLTVAGFQLDFGNCNGSVKWGVIICNNGNSTSTATTVEVVLEYCPFQFEFITLTVPPMRGRTCILLSGIKQGACSCAGINATVDPNNTVLESNENNNSNSTFECC